MSAALAKLRWQFVLGEDILSAAIAWYGEGYGGFSHVDALLPNGDLLGARNDRVGGKPPGVQLRPPEYERWKRRVVVELPSTIEQAAEWQKRLLAKVGDQYDRAAILGFLLGKAKHTRGYWICSALQTEVLEELERLPQLAVPPSQITPNTLLNVLLAIGGKITVRRNA